VRILTRALRRNSHRNPDPVTDWVNDEQFEILESGVLADEYGVRELTGGSAARS
jgi:hypothetical protein